MKQISTKQAQRNREIAKIKENLPSYCVICGKPAVDAAHLVPKKHVSRTLYKSLEYSWIVPGMSQ